jgi:acyl-CoA synthetase (AMP-forming)/AMP-acid ligase II
MDEAAAGAVGYSHGHRQEPGDIAMWLHAEIRSIPDIVRYHGRTRPAEPALVHGSGLMTFSDLDRITSRIARALVCTCPSSSDAVAAIGKNSMEFLQLLFGTTKAGRPFLPLNWRLAPRELASVLDDATPAIVFVDAEFAATMKAAQAASRHRCALVEFASSESGQGLEAWIADASADDPGLPANPCDTALLLYTSGTTGRPKGVQISHLGLNYMRLYESLEPTMDWRPDDVLLMAMPNFHLLGTGFAIQALYNGARVSILDVPDPQQILACVQRDRPTILVLAPSVIQMLLDQPALADTDFSSVRLILYAGSPINAAVLERAVTALQCGFMQFYGTTETAGAVTILRPSQHDLSNPESLKSCGTPLPLVDIRIVDGGGHELPDGEIGEILVRSPALFTGYLNHPEATRMAMSEGWYHTGDLGRRDRHGLLYLVDRLKDMIVTGGENVYSVEVEHALNKHPAVSGAAVVGVPDERWGEKVVAVVVLRAGANATSDELRQHCRELIASYKTPKEVRFTDSLPLSSAGKVLKRLVRDQLGATQS